MISNETLMSIVDLLRTPRVVCLPDLEPTGTISFSRSKQRRRLALLQAEQEHIQKEELQVSWTLWNSPGFLQFVVQGPDPHTILKSKYLRKTTKNR